MKFNNDDIAELVYSTPGAAFDGFELRRNDILDVDDWSHTRRLVFKAPDAKLYEVQLTVDNGGQDSHDDLTEKDEFEGEEVREEMYEQPVYLKANQ
jgi:hypothetical protein